MTYLRALHCLTVKPVETVVYENPAEKAPTFFKQPALERIKYDTLL
jgi:hypothetical protein